MSASPAPALDAIAFQLLATLDSYDRDMGRMVDTWLDMELYGRVSAQVEDIRLYCNALPKLSVRWVDLLIAHAELVHCLWRQQFQGGEGDERGQLLEMREHHASCVQSLRVRCLRELKSRL